MWNITLFISWTFYLMNTKLLKIVRRDYNIVYYPNGYQSILGHLYFKNAYVLFFKDQVIRAEFDRKLLIDYLVKHFVDNIQSQT